MALNPNPSQSIRYFMYFISAITLPITCSLSSGIVLYFACLNVLNSIQSLVFRVPSVRKRCQIPDLVATPVKGGVRQKGFMESVKETWTDLKGKHEKSQALSNYKTAISSKPVEVIRKYPAVSKASAKR